MIYLVCFAASTLFAHLANKTDKKNKFIIFSFVSIAVTVLLAGLRDYSIGIDTMNYLIKDRYWAGAISSNSLLDYLKFYFPLGYGEPLFALLVGVIAQYTGSFSFFLLVCHAIILACVYIGCFRFRKYINPAFVLVLFYLFSYNYSLNIMRQYMAIAIIFAFFADIHEKKYLRFCISVIIAALFHSTAIISLAFLLLYFLLYYQPKNNIINISTRQRMPLIAGFLFIVVLFFKPIISVLMNIGVLNKRYGFFLDPANASPALIVSTIAILVILTADYCRKEISEKFEKYVFFFMCSVSYFIILQLTYSVYFGKRISLYFEMANLITIGLIENSQKSKKVQKVVRVIILFIALLYWIYSNLLKNSNKTLPYAFCF